MKKILIVEDDAALSNGIILALKGDGYTFLQASSVASARQVLVETAVDLLILDVNLPDGNGLDLLRQVKRQSMGMPIIILTANDLETDIVTGLELGANDYITKPFSLMVLRARVHNQLRKSEHGASVHQFQQDGFFFDFSAMECKKNGISIELSKTEQKLLRLLVQNRGVTLLRADLVDKIWTDGAEYVDENALYVTVKRLRDKLEDLPSKPIYIKTIYGLGYTWAVK